MKALFFFLLILMPAINWGGGPVKKLDVPCDTIKLLNGRVVLGHIYYEDLSVVKYTNCNEDIRTKDQIPKYQVKEIAYGSAQHNQPFVDKKNRLNRKGIYLVITFAAVLIAAALLLIFFI